MKPTYEELQQRIAELERLQETALSDQGNLYKTLIESIPLAISIFDENGKFLFTNDNTEKLFELEIGSMTGKTLEQVFQKEDADSMMKVYSHIFETGKTVDSDRIIEWDGRKKAFKVIRQPIFDNHQKVKSILVIGQDISEQVRKEQLLNIQNGIDSLIHISSSLNDSLKKVLTSLMLIDWIDASGIYLFDDDRKHLRLVSSNGLSDDYINKVTVFSSTDALANIILQGTPIYLSEKDFIEPTKEPMVREGLTFISSIPIIHEKQVIGSMNLGSRSVNHINPSDRKVAESIANRLANLIIQIKTREQLIASNLLLQESIHEKEAQQQMLIQKSRLESLGELSAGLAHEINQPLSVISLVMENINYKLEQNVASEEYLSGKFDTISQNINKIRTLIDHVQIFSRDQGNIMFEKVDVNNMIKSSLSMI